jgi:hypothetical protein
MTKQQAKAAKDLHALGRNVATIATLLNLPAEQVRAVLGDKPTAKPAKVRKPKATERGLSEAEQWARASGELRARLGADRRPQRSYSDPVRASIERRQREIARAKRGGRSSLSVPDPGNRRKFFV